MFQYEIISDETTVIPHPAIGRIPCLQIEFERGYFIDRDGNRTECLIRNQDWQNNPERFSYQLNEASDVEQAGLAQVREFGVYDAFRFIAAEVDIDRASDDINKLDTKRNPTYEREQLFLKVLIEGRATLYSYKGEGLTRFFYSVNSGAISQLVYKRYLN